MWIIFILLGLSLLGCGCVAILFFPRKERPRTKLPRIVCVGDGITFGMAEHILQELEKKTVSIRL